jgi:hypothetical protein
MSISRKYGRTFHYPFSPGTSSDDRIHASYWDDVSVLSSVIHTEKLDGENNCLSKYGVFARSHAAPTVSSWTKALRDKWSLIKNDLGNYEIFGENVYAIHSIEYKNIEHHYYVFGVRKTTGGYHGKKQLLLPQRSIYLRFLYCMKNRISGIKYCMKKGSWKR